MLYVSTHQSCQINFMLLRRLGLADAGDRCSAPSRAEMGRQAEPHPHSTFNTPTFRHQRMHRGCATPPPSSSQDLVLGDSIYHVSYHRRPWPLHPLAVPRSAPRSAFSGTTLMLHAHASIAPYASAICIPSSILRCSMPLRCP
jgi:hypothetical protein